MFTMLAAALDDLARLQADLKRIKNYPHARNFYSIEIILVKMFVAIVPFALFPYAQDLGKSAGIGHWTVWLNVPFSAVVGWVFVSLEKVGENSSNPFEGALTMFRSRSLHGVSKSRCGSCLARRLISNRSKRRTASYFRDKAFLLAPPLWAAFCERPSERALFGRRAE
jgi:hypothetical protein